MKPLNPGDLEDILSFQEIPSDAESEVRSFRYDDDYIDNYKFFETDSNFNQFALLEVEPSTISSQVSYMSAVLVDVPSFASSSTVQINNEHSPPLSIPIVTKPTKKCKKHISTFKTERKPTKSDVH